MLRTITSWVMSAASFAVADAGGDEGPKPLERLGPTIVELRSGRPVVVDRACAALLISTY